MDTQTIVGLRTQRDNVKNSLQRLRAIKDSSEQYGSEQEYSIRDIVAEIDSILVDVSTLTKAPKKLIQKSTYSERAQLLGSLENLYIHIENATLDGIVSCIYEIKPLLRNLGVRYTGGKLGILDEHINEIQQKSSDLSHHIAAAEENETKVGKITEEVSQKHQELANEIESLNTQKDEFGAIFHETMEKRSALDLLLSEDKSRSEEIEQLLATSRGHVETINDFSKKIADRELQLENQGATTDHYKEKLEAFEAEHKQHLVDAQELIDKARRALAYRTAEGLSAAFTEQYKDANEVLSKDRWIILAGICVIAAIVLGLLLALEKNISLETVIARIFLFPILIGAAWFSALQYVKQKNIAEDYAYKAVLAKSIVGFSEQLSREDDDGKDRSYYIKQVLDQIHQDPLRKHVQKDSPVKKIAKIVTRTDDEEL